MSENSGFFCHVEGRDEKNNACFNIESIFKNIEHIMFVYLGISTHTYTYTTTKAIKEKEFINWKKRKGW